VVEVVRLSVSRLDAMDKIARYMLDSPGSPIRHAGWQHMRMMTIAAGKGTMGIIIFSLDQAGHTP
jgi:hypothetical protein